MIDVSTEPVVDVPAGSPSPGSTTSGSGADLGRVLACALLIAGAVASPALALLLAPFVPVLVGLRLLRGGEGTRRFLGVAGAACAIVAAGVALAPGASLPLSAALALALGMIAVGVVHARAAHPDPVPDGAAAASSRLRSDAEVAAEAAAWPEPRATSGFTPTAWAWFVLVALVTSLAVLVTGVGDLRTSAIREIGQSYAPYLDTCTRQTGSHRSALCDLLEEQRADALRLVRRWPLELLAGFVALAAVGSAATAHLLLVHRARRTGLSARRSWRLRELEVHWSSAYALAAGIGCWMLAASVAAGDARTALRVVAVALASAGAVLVLAHGIGAVTAMFTRRHLPRWYRIAVGIGAILFLHYAVGFAFVAGVVDLGLHLRRRGSGILTGRGSGS